MGARDGIGGYMQLERFGGRPYHEGAVALNSGRGCLAYLVELRSIRRVWLPDFMCACVPALFRRERVEVLTFPVGPDLLPDYGGVRPGPDDWMLLCDYYGQLAPADVDEARERFGGRLIVDETQGFFRRPWPGADTTYSCRKWFGVADGAYLATSDGSRLPRPVERDESHGRMSFVLGRAERPSSEFYAEASANNDFFDGEPAKLMSPITENILRAVDYGAARAARRRNWELLDAELGAGNRLEPTEPEGPFMYPYLAEKAGDVRARMADRGVFSPVLWPGCPAGTLAESLSDNIVALPLDQRYGEAEMGRVVEVLRACLR